jgi:hypothetical protein
MIAKMAPRTELPTWLQIIEQRLGEVDADLRTLADDIAVMEVRARRLNEERMHLRALMTMTQDAADAVSVTEVQSTTGEGQARKHTAAPGETASDQLATVRGESAATVLEPRSTTSAQLWKESVRDLLVRGGQPLHYRTIHQELRRLGVTFGGQNPAASFLAVLNRDPDFSRVGRGTYWVKGSVPHLDAEKPRAIIRRPRAKVRKRR